MGLRPRLIILLMVPLILIFGAYAVLQIREQHAGLEEQYRQYVDVTTRAIQIAVEQALRARQLRDIERLLSELVVKQTEIVRIRFFDVEFRPTLEANLLTGDGGIPTAALRRVIQTGVSESFDHRWNTAALRSRVVPLRPHGTDVEAAMEVVYLTARLEGQLRVATYDLALRIGTLLVVLAALTAIVLQRQVLRPLARLTEGIQRLGRGEPGPPLAATGRDELGRVTDAFNHMAEQLETSRRQLVAETERVLDLEQQLRRTETLAALGKLCSAVAHEVGTPLNVMSGGVELLLRKLPEGDPRRETLGVIDGEINRISGILRGLLNLVKPGKAELGPIALEAALERLWPLLRYTARRRGVRFTQDVEPRLPPMLADANQLQQVLLNLLTNALDATPAGGQVTLSAARHHRDGQPGIAIAVRDTGAGIPPDVLPHIFDPFFTTKPLDRGTGLGLTICRDIVRDHGGEIEVASEAGQGSTVTVWLRQADQGSS